MVIIAKKHEKRHVLEFNKSFELDAPFADPGKRQLFQDVGYMDILKNLSN